jgi:hypothetical protein
MTGHLTVNYDNDVSPYSVYVGDMVGGFRYKKPKKF